jgi:hypothetical protein
MDSKYPENKLKELLPTPQDESFPHKVYEVGLHGVLVARAEDSDYPRNHVALSHY